MRICISEGFIKKNKDLDQPTHLFLLEFLLCVKHVLRQCFLVLLSNAKLAWFKQNQISTILKNDDVVFSLTKY